MADSDHSAVRYVHTHDPESLLLLARPGDAGADTYCRNHLVAGAGPGFAPIEVVTDRQSAGAPFAPNGGGQTGVVLVVGDSTQSGGQAAVPAAEPASPPETVLATGGLDGAGATVDEFVTTWAASGHRPVVCIDALSDLLEYASIPATYRFLYVLLHRVNALDASAHVHADPREHEEEILRTFFRLFDRIVSFQTGGAYRE